MHFTVTIYYYIISKFQIKLPKIQKRSDRQKKHRAGE